MSWAEDQAWERDWWGNCCNSLSEDWKQLAYFKRLGFKPLEGAKTHYTFDVGWKMVLDIGGGPSSFLLRCVNVKGFVIDPCRYPAWVAARYAEATHAMLWQPETPSAEKWRPTPEWSSFQRLWARPAIIHGNKPTVSENQLRILQ
jgi:hypothetical protein